jgi:hypothetical protein
MLKFKGAPMDFNIYFCPRKNYKLPLKRKKQLANSQIASDVHIGETVRTIFRKAASPMLIYTKHVNKTTAHFNS